MKEFVRISIAPGAQFQGYPAFIKALKERGYTVRAGAGLSPESCEVLVPVEDVSWKSEIEQAVAERAVRPNWRADFIEQFYSEEERAAAPFFRIIHTGRDINFPVPKRDKTYGVCQVIDIDEGAACSECGAGAVQHGPIRLPAAEMNKAGAFASIWLGANTFYLVRDSLARDLERECGQPISRRAVKLIGKAKAKDGWWQLDPKQVIPLETVVPQRYQMQACAHCGAVRLREREAPFGGHLMLHRARIKAAAAEPIVLSPFWEGDLEHFPDGRVSEMPSHHIWFRADIAGLLTRAKIRGLDHYPITYVPE